MLEISKLYASKVPVEHVDEFTGPDEELKTFLQRMIERGEGSVGYDVPSGKELTGDDAAGASNRLWEGHQWKGIKEGLGL